jgi:hypothetical protein
MLRRRCPGLAPPCGRTPVPSSPHTLHCRYSNTNTHTAVVIGGGAGHPLKPLAPSVVPTVLVVEPGTPSFEEHRDRSGSGGGGGHGGGHGGGPGGGDGGGGGGFGAGVGVGHLTRLGTGGSVVTPHAGGGSGGFADVVGLGGAGGGIGTSVVDGKDASSAQPRVVVEMVFGRGDRDATGTEGASSLPPTVTMGPGTNAVATDVSADGLVEQPVCVCAGAGMPGWVPSYVHPPTPHAPC